MKGDEEKRVFGCGASTDFDNGAFAIITAANQGLQDIVLHLKAVSEGHNVSYGDTLELRLSSFDIGLTEPCRHFRTESNLPVLLGSQIVLGRLASPSQLDVRKPLPLRLRIFSRRPQAPWGTSCLGSRTQAFLWKTLLLS